MAESATRIAFTRMKNWQETMHSCNPLSVFLISSHGYQPHRLLLITQQPCKSCMEWKHFPITGETCMKHGVAFIVKERRCILPVRWALTVTAQKKKTGNCHFQHFLTAYQFLILQGVMKYAIRLLMASWEKANYWLVSLLRLYIHFCKPHGLGFSLCCKREHQ